MKVTRVRTFLVDPGSHKHWLFVRVETDDGRHGWGECYTQLDRDRAIELYVHQLGRYLVSRSPFDIKHFTYSAYTDFGGKRGSMDLYCAVSGMEIYTKTEFREVLERRAADILNPDVCNCGGILELREIAAMAEPYHIAVSPHNYNSTTVGLAATLHAAAGMPNFLITEYFVNFEETGAAIARPAFRVEGGSIALPTAPGLGIDLDETALGRHPYREPPLRALRRPEDE